MTLLFRLLLVVAAVVGVVAVSYPGGLLAAVGDAREYTGHVEALSEETDRDERLTHRAGALATRIRAKQAIVEDLLTERITLEQAADQFLLLNGDDPVPADRLHQMYGDGTLREKAARNVIDYAVVEVPQAEQGKVRSRLGEQFRAQFGYRR